MGSGCRQKVNGTPERPAYLGRLSVCRQTAQPEDSSSGAVFACVSDFARLTHTTARTVTSITTSTLLQNPPQEQNGTIPATAAAAQHRLATGAESSTPQAALKARRSPPRRGPT
jgi:hypothetical protein